MTPTSTTTTQYQPEPLPRTRAMSATLAMYQAALAHPHDATFNFDHVRVQIQMAADEVAMARTEKEMFFQYTAKAVLICAALYPHVHRKKDAKLLERYEEVKAQLKACHEGYIQVTRNETGKLVDYTLSVMIPGTKLPSDEADDEEEEDGGNEGMQSGTVQCDPSNFDVAKIVAEENLYRRLNCTARHIFYEALEMAFETDLLGMNDQISLPSNKIGMKELSQPSRGPPL